MTTPFTPPPSSPAATPHPAPPRAVPRVIAILTIALGVAVVLGTIGTAMFSTVASASVRTESDTLDVSGVTGLDVEAGAASLTLEFADVDEASLEVTSGRGIGDWTFERDGDQLRVKSPEWSWRSGWFSDERTRATLTLPETLQGAQFDARLGLSAGELIAEGRFGDLDLDVGAGRLDVSGQARTLSAELSAGGANLDLADVREALFRVSAGTMNADLTGAQPSTVDVDVSAGALDLNLPDGQYDVTSDVSAGNFDNELDVASDASSEVTVRISAGSVSIRT